jgi:NAD(P)-dependent dehydrogenase (short-subunit alcohol dehydrogenase family)
MGRLDDRVALVTGGAGGFGRAIAAAFVREGARVALTDIDDEGVKEAAAGLGAERAIGLAHDVTQPDAWRSAIDATVERFGALHVLVNNAGIGTMGTIEDTTLEVFRRTHAINVEGTFLGCQLALPHLQKAPAASIVNVSSVAAMVASGDTLAYSASKAAVRYLTKSVALHCAKQGYDVRCNSVHPAFVRTPILDPLVDALGEGVLDKLARQIPLGRLGRPEEIADAVVYLATSESSFVTGSELVIDGGISAM